MRIMKKRLERYLGACAKKAILRDKPTVVAIGGSVGKTSARQALSLALEASLRKDEFRASKKNYNNELGVPLSVFGCDAPGSDPFKWLSLLYTGMAYACGLKKLNMRYVVLEMAADHPGDLDYLISLARPSIAIMTAMGPEHTEYFGSVENAVAEERKLLQSLPPDGEAILNGDDADCRDSASSTQAEAIYYGRGPQSIVTIVGSKSIYDSLLPDKAGTEIELAVLQNHSYKFFLKGVFGDMHAYAIASALAFCVSMDHMSGPVIGYLQEHYKGMPGRSRLVPGIKNTMLLDDSYNAQPQAMKKAIHELAKFPVEAGSKRIAALGEMLELGDLAEKEHREIGRLVAANNIDFLVCCGKLARIIGDSAVNSGLPSDRVVYFENSSEAGLYIQHQILKKGDVVLIKGSQGSRMEKITKELMADPLLASTLLVRQTSEWRNK